MAGAGMRDVKRRIKSVESTMHITKAMQLVASSKLRKAKERVETARPYFNTLYDTIYALSAGSGTTGSIYTEVRPVKKVAYMVIAGDRGLAGGYNSNVFKFTEQIMDGRSAVIVPIGKKATEYFERRNYEVKLTSYATVEEIDLEKSLELARYITDMFKCGEVDEVNFIYTEFISMLSQQPTVRKILPLNFDEQSEDASEVRSMAQAEFDPSPGAVLGKIVLQYVGGMIHGALSESFASEQGARRTAMESASDNAEEMISSLSLMYNRARQGAITQEITEISAGAEALS